MSIDTAFTHFPSLTTKRLHLRQIQPSDAQALFAIFSDPQVMQFYGHELYQSLAEAQEFIALTQSRYDQRQALRWGITFHGEEKLLGTCSFHRFGPDFRRVETGYDLDRSFWGKGIMTEAMTAVLTYGFSDLNLHRIEAVIDIANDRSKALLLKLGFTYEGNLRQRYSFRDTFEDEHYFGLLKDEWHASI
jgi:ribosomal-protein-alanine N-acetyltransferase